jgi:kinesin family protein C1
MLNREDGNFRTRIPRPTIPVAAAKKRKGEEEGKMHPAGRGLDKENRGPSEPTTTTTAVTSTPQRKRTRTTNEDALSSRPVVSGSVSGVTAPQVAPASCARSCGRSTVRLALDEEDEALEELLKVRPRGKDKFDKVGKARACDEYLDALKPAVRALQERLMDARVALANADGRHEEQTRAIRERLSAVESGKARVETRLKEAIEEQERAEAEAKQASEAARVSDRAKVSAHRERDEADARAEEARAEADAATERADALRERVETLENEIKELKRALSDAESENEQVKASCEALREDKSKLTMDIGTLRGEKSGLEMQVETLQQKAQEHVKERESMREKTDKLHNDLAKARAEKDGSSQAMTRALEDAVEARAKAAKSAAEAEAAEERARRAEDAHAHATADLQRAREERNSAQEQLNALNAELELLKPQLAATEDKLKASAERVESTERQLRSMTLAKETLDSKVKQLTESLHANENKLTSQTERANAAELESTRLNAELIATRASKDALDPKLSKLGNELADARAESKQLRHDKERIENDLMSLKHAIQSLEGENATVKSKAQTLALEKSTLDERLRSEVEARRELEAELRQTKNLLQKANQNVSDERAKAMAAQDAIDDANTVKQQLSALQRAHSQQGEELARCKMEIANIVNDERSTSQLIARLQEVKNQLAAREDELHQAMVTRRHLHNTIQELKGNIRVFCRIRPSSENEQAFDDSNLAVDRKGEFAGRRLEIAPPDAPKKYDFTFDRVFAKNGNQKEVFDEVSLLVQSALDGYKVCIFTYGQTGSGKTYTMLGGKDDERGLIPRSMEQIFASQSLLERKGMKVSITATLLEIYNEDIRDLLSESPDVKVEHKIKHDDEGNTKVTNLVAVEVFSAMEVEDLMKQANAARAVAKTNMNDRSSRSHMVMRLCLDGVNEAGEPIHGALNLVDLAGSERLSRTGATGDRLKEAQAINKSLSSLGDVIFALANKEKHIPFRNSKLTYLLKNSLGGDCKTLMLVNVSPSLESAQETMCSLRFAAKVNSCALKSAKSSSKSSKSDVSKK